MRLSRARRSRRLRWSPRRCQLCGCQSSYMAEDDPPDRNWRSIATAQPAGPTKVKAGGVVSANQAASASAVLSQIARVNGLDQAFLVSNNRRASASKARATLWVKRQTQAMGRYAIKAADAIGKLVTLIQQAQATLSAPLPPLTTQDLEPGCARRSCTWTPNKLDVALVQVSTACLAASQGEEASSVTHPADALRELGLRRPRPAYTPC